MTSTPERYATRTASIDDSTPIARALPTVRRPTVGAWCFLDHAGPARFAPGRGMHVGAHPHIGLQTFTWMLEGDVVHRDSLGNEQVIRPGQVNLMTAGRGIAHTEDSARDGEALHAAQLWIALPGGERHGAPAFENHPTLPRVEAGGFTVTVLAGEALGHVAPARVYSPLVGLDVACAGAADALLPLDAGFEYAVMPLVGGATVEGEALAVGEWLYFAPGRSRLSLRCTSPARLLVLGGAPFGERLVMWWNLVARSHEEIEAARGDWEAGRFAPVRPGSLAGRIDAPPLGPGRLRPR